MRTKVRVRHRSGPHPASTRCPANDIDAPSMPFEQHQCSIDAVSEGHGEPSATASVSPQSLKRVSRQMN
jgi:hypothetical protein